MKTPLTKISDLVSALARLNEAIAETKDDLDRDGAIQRFEFTFELTWKVLQEYARYKGIETASPRDAFRVAADLGVIEDPTEWFTFLDDRNQTTHLYDKRAAEKIFAHLNAFAKAVADLIKQIQSKL